MACNPDCSQPADEPAHWMATSEDCMGGPTRGYWCQFLKCSDGYFAVGYGDTKEEAEERAHRRRETLEAELRLPPEARLKILAEGDLGDTAQREAIRLLIQIAVRNEGIKSGRE